MRKEVYNLEFPPNCTTMTIFSYRFTRVDDYKDRRASLQHLIPSSSGSPEFNIRANTGKHVVTAYVDLPENEQKAALAWAGSGYTALSDILLLLSIFSGRDVFVVDSAIDDFSGKVIIADSRVYPWGGTLGCSIPVKGRLMDPADPLSSYYIGFEEGLNQIYALIRSEEWQRKYQGGYFLFLAQQAFRNRSPDIAFTLCWVIWEHLFAILNREWLPEDRVRQIHSSEKVAFLLVKYDVKSNIGKEARKQIENWVKIRNRLVHFGRFPENDSKYTSEDSLVLDDVFSFIRWTESLIARILGLSPSNALYTKKMEKFKSGN